MNVLFVFPEKIDPIKGGGVGRVTDALAKNFKEKSIDSFYLATDDQDVKNENECIPQYYLPSNNLFSMENKSFLANLLKDKNIDIVVIQFGIEIKYLKLINSCRNNITKVLCVHHNTILGLLKNYKSIVSTSYSKKKWFKLIDNIIGFSILKLLHKIKYWYNFNYIIKNADCFVLLFENFIKELKYYGVGKSKKIIAIPNPNTIIYDEITFPEKKNSALYVGRIENAQKRVDVLIEIWNSLYKNNPSWELNIVGDGPDLENLKKNVQLKKIERVNFHGFQNPIPFYKMSKIFCMTSSYEGFGMVLTEAQIFKNVPIVFNCFSAMTEIITTEKNGFIIEEFEVEKYKSTLDNLMNNSKLLNSIADNAHEAALNWDINRIADIWIQNFNTLLTKGING